MRTDIPGIAAGGSAMFLVGTLTGVTALINSYPLYGGQALRYAAAAVILLAVASARRLPPARLTPRDVLLLAALAAVGMVGFNVCVIEATRAASPAMVGTVVGAVPVALAIAGPLLTRSAGRPRPSARVAAAAGVIVAGAALTTGLGTGSPRGLLFASGALACEAGFSLLAMPLLPKLGPIRVSGYAAAAAVPMALAAAAIADGPGMLPMPTTAQAAGLAYLAVVVSVGAFVLWYAALLRLGADRAGLLAGVVPIGAIATTVTLGLGHPTAADLAGAALVTAGLLLGLTPGRRRTPHARALPGTRPGSKAAAKHDVVAVEDPGQVAERIVQERPADVGNAMLTIVTSSSAVNTAAEVTIRTFRRDISPPPKPGSVPGSMIGPGNGRQSDRPRTGSLSSESGDRHKCRWRVRVV